MAKSPEIALCCAAKFWNNHLVYLGRGQDAEPSECNALKIIKLAPQLDPEVKSTFIDHALANEPAIVAVEGEKRIAVDGVRTVNFETGKGAGPHSESGKLRGIVATNHGTVAVEQERRG